MSQTSEKAEAGNGNGKEKELTHYYKVTYNVTCHIPGGVPQEEVPKGHGAADALFVGSVLRDPNGAVSYLFTSVDGDNDGKDLATSDMFRLWAILAHSLSKELEEGTGRQELCAEVHRVVSESLAKARQAIEGGESPTP